MISEINVISKDVIRQRHLEQLVKKIFPSDSVTSNARSKGDLKNPVTGQFLELDIWIPSKKLCFEFQDLHHYVATTYSQKPLDIVQAQDTLKQRSVRSKGYTLLHVPCWWNGRVDSLISEVAFSRPDLIATTPELRKVFVPLNPTPDFFAPRGIPNIGELMLASFSENKIADFISPTTPWWLGEKYDGIRLCWNGITREVYARSGAVLTLYHQFHRSLPRDVCLDGEIWFGRGGYSESHAILQVGQEDIEWQNLRFIVFDDPSFSHRNTIFEKRYKRLLSIKPAHPFLITAFRMLHGNNKKKTIAEITQFILDDGGEGVILRKPRSLYEAGRSSNLIKLKATRADMEALVVALKGDRFELQLPDGTTFYAPDQIDEPKPKKGDVVTFEFEYAPRSIIPANPRITRIRKDLSWKEVQYNFERDSKLNEYSRRVIGSTQQNTPPGFWTSEKGKNMRKIFEKFARNEGFDPLLAENWYHVPRQALLKSPIAATVHSHYNGSVVRALLDVFPDIGLDQTKFPIVSHNYWRNIDNRRNFIISVAKAKGFDALQADAWYSRSNRAAVLAEKRVLSILELYANNLSDTLVHLFPEIGINPAKFAALPYNHWEEEENRRKVFVEFAAKHGKDPLVPDSWYSLMKSTGVDIQDTTAVLFYYGGDVVKALTNLFPNIGLEEKILRDLHDAHWKDFISQFIVVNQIDPLVPDNWYQFTRDKYVQVGYEAHRVVHNRHSFIWEVMHMFPSIKLDVSKFSLLNSEFTRDTISIKRFFERFAKKRNFNPALPENWYRVQKSEILKEKGASSILFQNDGSFVRGLTNAFPDIGLQAHRFETMSKNYWHKAANRRQFLKYIAKTKFGIDPTNPQHWYRLPLRKLASIKEVKLILAFHSGMLEKTLQDLFPELHLDLTKFNSKLIKTKM